MKKHILPLLLVLGSFSSTINAQVGINMPDPHAPLQFKNETVNRKIVMYETGNNDNEFYGFGVNSGIMRYQADRTTTDHVFFAGVTGGASSNELMRIKGTGNVGIATSAPAAKLDIVGTTFGIKNSQTSGSWDNLWFNVTPAIPSINASGAESGLRFNVGTNSTGTYGDGQTLTTVSTMLANGNMGIGTTAPSNRLDLGANVGSSVTDVVGKKLAVYNDANGTDFYGLGVSAAILQFHAASTASEAPGMVLTSTGLVGIGNTNPTNTLDISGTTRVRTINSATGSTVINPVYSDPTGVLVKPAVPTFGSVISNTSASIGSGTTGALITGMVDGGIYRAIIRVGDACANTGTTEIFIVSTSANSNFAIRGVTGILSSGTKAPTFTEPNGQTTVVTWTSKPGCAGGDNSTAFNYTLTMPSATSIDITNNGNIAKTYNIVLTRLN